MADEMKRLEAELKKGVNKRQALTAMGGGGSRKPKEKGGRRTAPRKRG